MIAFRRITSSGRFVPEIDGLRFAAIAAVVLYHFHGFFVATGSAAPAVTAVAEHGYRGVNLFYVLSGFLLGLPFAAHDLTGAPRVRLKRYFLRRLTRLEPPYILNLLLVWAAGGAAATLLPSLLASLGYAHGFVFGEQSAINPVAWTLEVEVQFYCAAPLLAGLFAIRPRRVRLAVLFGTMLAAGALQLLWWDAPARVRLSLAFAIQYFLAGFVLADIYLLDWHERPATRRRYDLLALAPWPPILLGADRTIWLALPLLLLAVCLGVFRGTAARALFRLPAVTAIGGMCYSIYLFHYVLIPPVRRLLAGWNGSFALQFAGYSAIVLIVSAAWFLLIERPCMRSDWPARLAGWWRQVNSSV